MQQILEFNIQKSNATNFKKQIVDGIEGGFMLPRQTMLMLQTKC